MANAISSINAVLARVAAHRRGIRRGVLALLVALGGWYAITVVSGLPEEEAIRELANGSPGTVLLDVKGRELGRIGRERRIEVPLAQVSPHLVRAVLAVEDQRFLEHRGVDVVRIAAAFATNLRQRRVIEGGSTITQQLARRSFLTREKTLRRKMREAIIAARIERAFTKKQILEFYLNKVYFGDGLYGVETAALGYFGKHASELDLSEAALLTGLLRSPSTCAPTVDLACALERRALVLRVMRDNGVIDRATEAAANAAPVRLQDNRPRERALGGHFKAEVRRQLVEQFGHEQVYEGHLIVQTTLDVDLQRAAEMEVQAAVHEIEARTQRRRPPGPDDVLQAALVTLDVRSGEVRAMVGGRDFAQSHYNRATRARRQPGSAFKPFVYAAALEHGFTPVTRIHDLRMPVRTREGPWTPDDRRTSIGSMTLRTALRTSNNRAAVRTLTDVGIPATMQYLERFGFESIPGVPSLALGSGEVTLLSLTTAFATFANAGQRVPPAMIRRVESIDGDLLYQHQPLPEPVVSEATAFIMTSLLSDVVAAAQAGAIVTVPAAGKTGTTNDYHDAWFVGYTPSLATGVWIGYDQPRPIMEDGYAAGIALPLWARFMTAATRGGAPEPFAMPSSIRPVTICRLSGRLATDRCSSTPYSAVDTEYFAAGTEPGEYCDAHDRPFDEEALFDPNAVLDAHVMDALDAVGTTGVDPRTAPAAPMPPTPPPPAPRLSAPSPGTLPNRPRAGATPARESPPAERGVPSLPGPGTGEAPVPPPPAPAPPGG